MASSHLVTPTKQRENKMKATFVKSGTNYLPAIKFTYSGNVKVLHGDPLATAAMARKYAQIEINQLTPTTKI